MTLSRSRTPRRTVHPDPCARRGRCGGERGVATVSVAFAAGLVLLVVVQIVNVMVFQFGLGVVRAGLDEGARAGALTGDVQVCEQRANATVNDLAAGMAAGVTITCTVDGPSMTATARVAWDGWLAGVANHNSTITASAALENQ